MKKILVSGSSVSAGVGFPLGINDPGTWPNQLKTKLNCQLDNTSAPGCDISTVFLNATKLMHENHYDIILLEIPPLNRLLVTPNINGWIDINGKYKYDDLPAWHEWFENHLHVSKKDLNFVFKILSVLNTDWLHWKKFIGVITATQLLNKQGLKIRIINNGLTWNKDFFDFKDSSFARQIINDSFLSDEEILIGLSELEKDKALINLTQWINPFSPLINRSIDSAPNDNHPVPKSNDQTSNFIITYIEHNRLWQN